MTLKQVADYLQVNERTIYRLVADKRLPGFKVGTVWRFARTDLDAWIKRQSTNEPNTQQSDGIDNECQLKEESK